MTGHKRCCVAGDPPEEDVKLAGGHTEEEVNKPAAAQPEVEVKLAAQSEEEVKKCNIPQEVSNETQKS